MKTASKNEEIWFLSGKRTPFGTFGGALKDLSATDLGVESAKAALAAAKVSPEDVHHVVYGNVMQTSADAIYLRTSDLAEIRVTRSQVEEMMPSNVSLMPEGLEKTMSRQELSDLLEFLYGQK